VREVAEDAQRDATVSGLGHRARQRERVVRHDEGVALAVRHEGGRAHLARGRERVVRGVLAEPSEAVVGAPGGLRR
jgi:hypothetical protein